LFQSQFTLGNRDLPVKYETSTKSAYNLPKPEQTQ